ncbi:MAG: hypothetical protein ACM3MG_03955 [Bacillota bacterium]
MVKRWKWVFAGLITLSLSAFALEQILYHTSGASSFDFKKDVNGFRQVVRNIQDYHLLTVFNPDSSQNLYLVDSKLTRRFSIDVDGVFGSLSWKVRTGDKLQSLLWSKSENATLIDFDDNYHLVVTGLEQCCGAMTGYRVYDVTNGRLIISFNSFTDEPIVTHPFVLDIPNTSMSPRFLGIISGDSTRDKDFQTPASGMMNTALIKYGSKTQFFQRLQLDMKVADGFAPSILSATLEKNPAIPNSNKIEFNGTIAEMWNIDGSNNPSEIQGVQLKLILNGGDGDKTVIIPVIEDRLNLAMATVPAGVSLKGL